MKRVLIVAADGLSKSGVPNVFMNIIKNISQYGVVFDVAYFDKEQPYYKSEIEEYGGKAIFIESNFAKSGKIARLKDKMLLCLRIKKVIKKFGPYDAVHSFKGYESGYVLKAAKKMKVKIRIAHQCFVYRKPSKFLQLVLDKNEINRTKKYFTTMLYDPNHKKMVEPSFLPNGKVVPNYYDEEKLSYSPLSKTNNPIEMIQIGSFSDNKNQLFSIKVLEEILKEYPSSKLHFVGFPNPDDNSYYDSVVKYVDSNNLKQNIMFHNFDADVGELFAKCNYCLFPSRLEAFGIVPVEAQACGLICFCSDTISQENNCGGCVYLPIDDPTLWANRITKLFIENKGQHTKFDMSKFEKKSINEKYKTLYELN